MIDHKCFVFIVKSVLRTWIFAKRCCSFYQEFRSADYHDIVVLANVDDVLQIPDPQWLLQPLLLSNGTGKSTQELR